MLVRPSAELRPVALLKLAQGWLARPRQRWGWRTTPAFAQATTRTKPAGQQQVCAGLAGCCALPFLRAFGQISARRGRERQSASAQ